MFLSNFNIYQSFKIIKLRYNTCTKYEIFIKFFCRYIFPERFCIEPKGDDVGVVSSSYLEIDRDSDKISLKSFKF